MIKIESKTCFLLDLDSILKEESSEHFRRVTLLWLKNYPRLLVMYLSHLDFPLKDRTFVQQKIFSVFGKIKQQLTEERYAITRFKQGKFDRNIPILEIIPREVDNNNFILTEIPPNRPGINSREEIDAIVQALAQVHLPWNALNACDDRAEICCQLLKAMNISPKKIKKIWIKSNGKAFPVNTPYDQITIWRWHITPLVIADTGEKFVIDLFFNQTRALLPSEWINMIAKKSKFDFGEINCEYTCDMSTKREILVTDSMFNEFLHRINAYNYITKVAHDNNSEMIMEELLLPPRVTLNLEPSNRPLHPLAFILDRVPPQDSLTSTCCTVS